VYKRVSASVAVILLAVVISAAAVRLVPALHQPLWLDEVVSARIITQPNVSDAVTRVKKSESSPPGWHLVNWVLWRATGRPHRVERLRLLSVAFGGLLAGLVVLYGLSIGLTAPGVAVAGGLAALGPNVVAHGAELRPYALLTLIALIFAMVLQIAARTPSNARLVLLAVVVAIGSYVHYFFLLSLATGIAWSLMRLSGRHRTRVVGAMLAGLVAFVVWLPSFRFQYRHNLYAYNGSFNLRAVAYSYARIVGLLGETGVLTAIVRLLFGFAVVAGALLLLRRRDGELAALFTILPVTLTAIVWLLGPHIFNERNLLIALPFAAVSVGMLVAALPRPASLLLLVLLSTTVAVSLYQFEIDYGRSSYDGIANALVASGWHPTDQIVQFGPAPLGLSQPVGWYLPGHPTLARATRLNCGRLFAVSYDTGAGPRWIRAHLASHATQYRFKAYDHTPRGPASPTPIVVARVKHGTANVNGALADGARLLHGQGSSCG
jgi:Dolichyl-phosphate-mannose-protein mannosyltransferase